MTYVYKCRQCAAVFERQEPITAPPLTEHDGCGGPVFRVLQPIQVTFYGEGFHCNDYGKRFKED